MKLRARLAVALVSMLAAAGVRPADAAETNFITDFGFNGRHAYFYVAREKGYYKAEGFDVNLMQSRRSPPASRRLASPMPARWCWHAAMTASR